MPLFINILALIAVAVSTAACGTEAEESAPIEGLHRVNAYQMITGDDSDEEREHWNHAFRSQSNIFGEEPVSFVKDNLRLLPRGKALVLAMEEGRNAVFLAKNGYDVTGIDFSDEAIRKAKRLAFKNRVKLHVINADLNTYNIEPAAYDVIVAIEFFRPRLINEIKKGLKPGGVILWESHTTDLAKFSPSKTVRTDHLLRPGELRSAFDDYVTLVSRETKDDSRAVASLVAKKPVIVE